MSEETQDKAPPAKAAPKKAAPALPLHLLVPAGAGLVAAAIGITAGLLLVGPQVVALRNKMPAAAQHEKKEKKEKGGKEGAKPTVFKLENLIVNPAGSGGTRFLLASVAIEVADDKVEARLRERDFQMRDVVISVLERQTLDAISTPGARDSIKVQLARVMGPLIGTEPAALHVYLPQFVIQ
jgi:flagellar protein FliL